MCQPGSSTKWIPRRRSFPATMASCCASSSARAFADCCWAMAGMNAEATYRNAAQTRVGVEITLLFYAAGTAPDFDQKKCGPEAEDAFRAALTELRNQITALNRMMSQGCSFAAPDIIRFPLWQYVPDAHVAHAEMSILGRARSHEPRSASQVRSLRDQQHRAVLRVLPEGLGPFDRSLLERPVGAVG